MYMYMNLAADQCCIYKKCGCCVHICMRSCSSCKDICTCTYVVALMYCTPSLLFDPPLSVNTPPSPNPLPLFPSSFISLHSSLLLLLLLFPPAIEEIPQNMQFCRSLSILELSSNPLLR